MLKASKYLLDEISSPVNRAAFIKYMYDVSVEATQKGNCSIDSVLNRATELFCILKEKEKSKDVYNIDLYIYKYDSQSYYVIINLFPKDKLVTKPKNNMIH